MQKLLRYREFLNESALNESGIPLYRGAVFTPEKNIKRNKLLPEIQDLLGQVMSGELKEVTVVADLPAQGKNAPQYLKDIYSEMGIDIEKMGEDDDDDSYDPETDVYMGKRDSVDEPKRNIFVDSEFLIRNVDMEKGVILGTPYSLRIKKPDIVVEIHPDLVYEVFVK